MRDWREQQLSWFEHDAVIRQDYELLEKIKQVNPRSILFKGDSDYFQSQFKIYHGPYDFCIYIVNHQFDVNDLIIDVNNIIASELENQSILYLSINKYLLRTMMYDTNLSKDYDVAIKEFVSQRVTASLLEYHSAEADNGKMFNFAHPLTRFYFKILK